ncbi:MAG: hypothetical protein QW699_05635 [Metallosphaera sp.]
MLSKGIKVFPPDNERIFILTTVDGKFDSQEEGFSIQITNIRGEREYQLIVMVKDLARNERQVEMRTPYIRQF